MSLYLGGPCGRHIEALGSEGKSVVRDYLCLSQAHEEVGAIVDSPMNTARANSYGARVGWGWGGVEKEELLGRTAIFIRRSKPALTVDGDVAGS